MPSHEPIIYHYADTPCPANGRCWHAPQCSVAEAPEITFEEIVRDLVPVESNPCAWEDCPKNAEGRVHYRPCGCAWWGCWDHYTAIYDRWQTIMQCGNDMPVCTGGLTTPHAREIIEKILWFPLA